MRTQSRLHPIIVALVLVVIGVAFSVANAETTFGASATTANGELTTTLTWESTLSSCVGSGHPAWAGPKTSSGTQELPAITMSGTYSLTLTCSSPDDRSAKLTWENPTENTDGTAYTNHAGTRIHYGRSASVLAQTVDVMDPAATTHTIENLDLGEWFFAVRAVNSNGAESALSNVAAKTMREGSTESESVSLTVNPVPAAGVLTSVE